MNPLYTECIRSECAVRIRCCSSAPKPLVFRLVLVVCVPHRVQVKTAIAPPEHPSILLTEDAIRPKALLIILSLPLLCFCLLCWLVEVVNGETVRGVSPLYKKLRSVSIIVSSVLGSTHAIGRPIPSICSEARVLPAETLQLRRQPLSVERGPHNFVHSLDHPVDPAIRTQLS